MTLALFGLTLASSDSKFVPPDWRSAQIGLTFGRIDLRLGRIDSKFERIDWTLAGPGSRFGPFDRKLEPLGSIFEAVAQSRRPFELKIVVKS